MMNSLDRIELVHGKHFKIKIELMNVICRSENMNMKRKIQAKRYKS